jgi:cellulose synthase/poly-beta-1,6-N-acetylglucosamine synthase-like glycosyltransferase
LISNGTESKPMRSSETIASRPPPLLSVVIPVWERHEETQLCLGALATQQMAPPFEIIVVDDGSKMAWTPDPVAVPGCQALRVIRQRHSGPGAARNAGIAAAYGTIIVFVDSDVLASSSLLRLIALAASQHPGRVAFQPRLTSGGTRLAHRIEHARLTAIQETLNRPDGTIAYLNTSAFAVRRDYARRNEPFFCPGVSRGEDTLVLARLASEGQLPCFLPAVTADHRPPGPTIRYLARHLRIGRQTQHSRNQLAVMPGVLLSWSDRWRTLRSLHQNAGAGAAGGLVTALAVAAYTLEVCGRAVGHMSLRQGRHALDRQRRDSRTSQPASKRAGGQPGR